MRADKVLKTFGALKRMCIVRSANLDGKVLYGRVVVATEMYGGKIWGPVYRTTEAFRILFLFKFGTFGNRLRYRKKKYHD